MVTLGFYFLGWLLNNLNYTKSNKVITWIFGTIMNRVTKKSKIVVTSKPKRIDNHNIFLGIIFKEKWN